MSGVRQVTAPMRAIFIVGGLFVLIAGVQLFVFSKRTDDFFAWTIEPAATAMFLGAFYLNACVLAFASSRERDWDKARIGVPGVLAFVWITLAATLIHIDKFHLDDEPFIPTLAAWTWLVIYVIEPPVLAVVYYLQLRAPGGDSPATAPIPGPFKAAAAALGALLVVLGIVLFAVPDTSDELWPWALTPLTARASSAWLVGQGLVLVTLAWDGDWIRARWANLSMILLTVLLGIGLARDSDSLPWEGWPNVVYVIVLPIVFTGAAYGWFAARRAEG